MSARIEIFRYFRRRAAARSGGVRAFFVLLALSVSLQICAPAFVSASPDTFSGNVTQSSANGALDTHALNFNEKNSECCVFAAQHTERGQIIPFAISPDFVYLPPLHPNVIDLAETISNAAKLVSPTAPRAFAPARVPIYLATQRFRN